MTLDFTFLILVPALLIAADYLNGFAMFKMLRRDYPDVWKQLDQPDLDASNYASSRLKLARFIWTGRFLQLSNGRLSAHCAAAIVFQVALVGCLAFGLLRVV